MKIIALARLELTGLRDTGRTVRLDGNYYPELKHVWQAKALIWLNSGDDNDVHKARIYAHANNYRVITMPLDEKDPIQTAKNAVLKTKPQE